MAERGMVKRASVWQHLSGPVLVLALGLAGCTATAPRFRTADAVDPRRARGAGTVSRIPSTVPRASAKDRPAENLPLPADLGRDKMLLEIVGLLGTPYVYGGTGDAGLDCSAFTARVYERSTSRRLARSAEEQFYEGEAVPREELRFGDLVFFRTDGRRASHVGIYIEDDLFAHASTTSGVTISSLESSYYYQRYVGARRIITEGHD
jgi:cell wall-associated NlpC family hydrolase